MKSVTNIKLDQKRARNPYRFCIHNFSNTRGLFTLYYARGCGSHKGPTVVHEKKFTEPMLLKYQIIKF